MKSQRQRIIAISGVKDSGKTTLITNLIPLLQEKQLKVATIKHDGHDFIPDVKGTDTYKHRESGAYGVGIFSSNKWMIIKEEREISISSLINQFPEVDLILLEGFKYSNFPKIEIIRREVSLSPVSDPKTVIGYVSDLGVISPNIKQFKLDEIKELAEYMYNYIIKEQVGDK